MDRPRNERKPRRSAALVVIAAIVLLILGFIAWNRYEARDGGDAAVGPAAATSLDGQRPRPAA